MANVKKIEDQIKADWNMVRAFIALHPYWSVGIALVIGNALGAVTGI